MSDETAIQKPKAKGRAAPVVKTGVVDSVSGSKTVRVTMNALVKDKLYGKYMRNRTRMLVHDEKQEAQVRDTVEIAMCRHISKRKSWRLVRVVKRPTVA